MANQISISCDPKVQLHAAKAFSSILKELKINHDVIGGFALSLFGSSRHTNDVEILVDLAPNQIRDVLRPQITRINQHFVELGLKFYYVPTLVDGLAVKELVSINKGNVLIETLATNTLGLPLEADPAMIIYPGQTEEDSLKRWAQISTSTYPPSIRKAKTDLADIIFLVEWQAARNVTISFQAYKAQQPERLYQAVKTLALYLEGKEMMGPWALLKKVVTVNDWQQMSLGTEEALAQ